MCRSKSPACVCPSPSCWGSSSELRKLLLTCGVFPGQLKPTCHGTYLGYSKRLLRLHFYTCRSITITGDLLNVKKVCETVKLTAQFQEDPFSENTSLEQRSCRSQVALTRSNRIDFIPAHLPMFDMFLPSFDADGYILKYQNILRKKGKKKKKHRNCFYTKLAAAASFAFSRVRFCATP